MIRPCLSFFLLLAAAWPAGAVTVPNFSFETPNIVYADPGPPTGWSKVETDPPQIGIFDDTGFNTDGSPKPDHIDNVDGQQVLFFFGVPNIELFQEIPSVYEVGTPYVLTIGAGGNSGLTIGSTFAVRLFYRALNGSEQVIASTSVTYTQALADKDPGSINHLFDYSVNIAAVKAGDPWAGKPIGISIYGVSGNGNYWDMDNVRLIPEPGIVGLLVLGGVAGFAGRRPSRSRRTTREFGRQEGGKANGRSARSPKNFLPSCLLNFVPLSSVQNPCVWFPLRQLKRTSKNKRHSDA